MKMHIPEGHNWAGRKVKNVNMPTGSLAIMIKRGEESIVTRGDTRIEAGDDVILSVIPYESEDTEKLQEIKIEKDHEWCQKTIRELQLPEYMIIAMILRGEETLIPDGDTVILEKDDVVLFQQK